MPARFRPLRPMRRDPWRHGRRDACSLHSLRPEASPGSRRCAPAQPRLFYRRAGRCAGRKGGFGFGWGLAPVSSGAPVYPCAPVNSGAREGGTSTSSGAAGGSAIAPVLPVTSLRRPCRAREPRPGGSRAPATAGRPGGRLQLGIGKICGELCGVRRSRGAEGTIDTPALSCPCSFEVPGEGVRSNEPIALGPLRCGISGLPPAHLRMAAVVAKQRREKPSSISPGSVLEFPGCPAPSRATARLVFVYSSIRVPTPSKASPRFTLRLVMR
jgi:hypothetical protein